MPRLDRAERLLSPRAGKSSQHPRRKRSNSTWLGHLPTFGGLGRPPPPMYGRVREQTIWSYWHHPEACPSSKECAMPAEVARCSRSSARHRGAFDFRLLRADEVPLYVSDLELPASWRRLPPGPQADAVMAALLARYGGVALGAALCLARPLDGDWGEMLARGATLLAYPCAAPGLPCAEPRPGAAGLLMARREGVLRTAASLQAASEWPPPASAARLPSSSFGGDLLAAVLPLFGYSSRCGGDAAAGGFQVLASAPQGGSHREHLILLRNPHEGPAVPLTTLADSSGAIGLHANYSHSSVASGSVHHRSNGA